MRIRNLLLGFAMTSTCFLGVNISAQDSQIDQGCSRINTLSQAYTVAAENGDSDAQFKLGKMYALGDGICEDSVESLKWFKKADEQGHEDAGWAAGEAKRIVELEQNAAQGDEQKQYNLGIMFAGDSFSYLSNTTRRDKSEKWLTMAAERGYLTAQLKLAMIYRNIKDYGGSVEWLEEAVKHGDSDAQLMLGEVFASGMGLQQNYTQALKWVLLSSKQGNQKAMEFAPKLRAEMTPEMIAEANALAEACIAENLKGCF